MQVADLRPRLRPRDHAAADTYLARPYDARWCVEGPGLPPLPVDTREEAERLRDLLDAAFDAGAKCGARERTRARRRPAGRPVGARLRAQPRPRPDRAAARPPRVARIRAVDFLADFG